MPQCKDTLRLPSSLPLRAMRTALVRPFVVSLEISTPFGTLLMPVFLAMLHCIADPFKADYLSFNFILIPSIP